MKNAIMAMVPFALLFALEKPADSAEAWSIGSFACTVWTVGGTVDDVTHGTDSSPYMYGRYTTTSNNGVSYIQCPVWLPHETSIDTFRIRATDPYSGDSCVVEASLFRQRSIYGTTEPTTDDYVLVSTCKTDFVSSTPTIKTCTFTPETVCNYNDSDEACDDDTEAYFYFVVAKIQAAENNKPKLYSVWVGDPPMSSKEFYESYSDAFPIDCGWVMEKYLEGLEISEEEKGCFIMYEMSVP